MLITTIIIGTVYGVLTMGIKSYKKIGIEGELHDEANYMIARILSEIYQTTPDLIAKCPGSNDCFTVKNSMKLEAKELEKSTEDNKVVGYRLKETELTGGNELTIKLENSSLFMNTSQLNSENIIIDSGSSISFKCTNEQPNGSCLNAIINFNLLLQNKNHKEPTSTLYVPPQAYHSSIGF